MDVINGDRLGESQKVNTEICVALAQFKHLLERQAGFVRQGNIHEAESLVEQANCLVDLMKNSGVFESVEFESRRDEFQQLYNELCLGLGAEKAGIVEQLLRIRKSRKTVGAYRSNM
jgi:hypothetical protein